LVIAMNQRLSATILTALAAVVFPAATAFAQLVINLNGLAGLEQALCSMLGCHPVITRIVLPSTIGPSTAVLLEGTNFGTWTGRQQFPGQLTLSIQNAEGQFLNVQLESSAFGDTWASGIIPESVDHGFRGQMAGIVVTTPLGHNSDPLRVQFVPLQIVEQLPAGHTTLEACASLTFYDLCNTDITRSGALENAD
jgi:hypothetical protein